jgi:tetratricopeptide (TPR) repeat protein/tRNA A-37 threonylcarbamoyl transferase component Bud32
MSCLNEETIVAFIDARLAPDSIARVESHARNCTSCRELLSVALAVAPAPRVTERPLRESTHVGADEQAPPGGATLVRGGSFARYTVLGPLGHGAMGEVYAAYDPELDRKVALKILHRRGDGADERNRSRLLREAKAIAKLRHPNVVVVHDAGTIEGRVFLAMEHVEGQTLAAWLAAQPRTRKEILEVFIAAGRGLGAAHAAGLAHRDFKPQNVMVGSDGGVHVMDFGLAREIGAPAEADVADPAAEGEPTARSEGADSPLTRTGELVGTPFYMAPEQFKTQRADARSDQFSFCVALYHALYGAHPFGGGKLGDLIAAVTAGRVQPPPAKSTVPVWLRRILLRGLSVDPALRWESMEALTAALSRDPARQRRLWFVGTAVGAALIVGVVALRAPRTSESICRGGAARLAGVWEPENASNATATRRDATRAAFVKTGVAGAADAWERAARVLDRYTADWLRAYGDTCAATHLRGEQSPDVLDLRMACLQERLGRVKALTDVFVDANPNVVENAVTASSALPTLERCADVKLLRAVMPPPDDPEVRARVATLRNDLARVKALNDSGQCAAAAEGRRKLIADADALGYPPLQAESLTATSRLSTCVGYNEALPSYRRAVLLAMASGHDEAAAEAAIYVAQSHADRTPDIARARDWIDIATAIMRGMNDDHRVLETWRLEALAVIYDKEGETDKAHATIERALTLMEKTQGSEHLDYANALNILGLAYFEEKRFEEAVNAYRRSARTASKVGGVDHPIAALALANAAESLNILRRYDEARGDAEEALRIWRRAGSAAMNQAFALTNLGEALIGQGRPREAVARLEEALRLLPADLTVVAPPARFALARALWETPEHRTRALALAREAKTGYQRLGNVAPEVARVDAWLQLHARTDATPAAARAIGPYITTSR